MKNEKGAVSLLVALTIPVLLGVAALAVDMAHVWLVRNELQNDADAAALAGARYLYEDGTASLDWATAAQRAQQAIALNRADGHPLRDGQIQVGYWNLTQTPASLQSLPVVPTVNDVPAVQVTLSKSNGQNQGPVTTFFARFLGVLSKPVQVTAVAGPTSPGSIFPGGLFPLAISGCMYQNYWNSGVSPAAPQLDPKTGQAWIFKIGSTYHYGACESGGWTSLETKTSSENFLKDLISEGNDIAMSIGDAAWMPTGSMSDLYKKVSQCSADGNKQCEYVVVSVMDQVRAGNASVITGFACLHILDAEGGSKKYISAQMSNRCEPTFTGGVGPNFGVISPPSLLH